MEAVETRAELTTRLILRVLDASAPVDRHGTEEHLAPLRFVSPLGGETGTEVKRGRS